MPFNFSKMIFDYLVEIVVGKKDTFLMYPRFLQLLFNSQIPNLAGQEGDILVFAHMDIKTVRSMKDYSSKQVRPKEARLFGHLINLDYVCPPEDRWRNDGSDDEEEEIAVTQVTEASGSKRKEAEEGDEEVEEVEVPLKRRKRPNLMLVPRATIPSTTESEPIPDPAASIATDAAASASTTTTTPPVQAAGSSSSTKIDEQMANMQQLVIAMMNKMNKQEEKIEKMEKEKVEMIELVEQVKKEKEETAEIVRQMRLENAETSNLLLLEMGKNKKMEERVAEVEKRYDDLQSIMIRDSEGYFRDKDYVGSDSDVEEAPRITSTSAGTSDAAK